MSSDAQVTRFVINKMNTERYEEMKNAGTLPPNSLILTPDNTPDTKAEVNASNLTNENVETWKEKLNVKSSENVETVYDMNDPTRWIIGGTAYTSGIQGNVALTVDLNKYKRLRFVAKIYPNSSTNTGGYNDVFELDLKSNSDSNWKIATAVFAYPVSTQTFDSYGSTWKVAVWYNIQSLELKFSFGFGANKNESYNNKESAVIIKIVGVY